MIDFAPGKPYHIYMNTRMTRATRENEPSPSGGAMVLYRADDGSVAVDVRLDHDTIWLSQKQMAGLFATERSVISKHLRNIFKTKELDEQSVSAFFAHTAADGKTYQVQFYNLDAIISVGYRVNSKRGTHFRIWATNVLRQHGDVPPPWKWCAQLPAGASPTPRECRRPRRLCGVHIQPQDASRKNQIRGMHGIEVWYSFMRATNMMHTEP